MLPVVALVGRPNVGKSTLFNQLTRSREALVADQPGLTRDRKYGWGKVGDRPYLVVDTGGLSGEEEGIEELMARQTRLAIDESDVILFLVDARDGLTAGDQAVAEELRRRGKPVFLVVNKIDGVNPDLALAEFHALGLGEPHPLAAAHGRGVARLMEAVMPALPKAEEAAEGEEEGIRVAVIGRPNVGKSTLINRLIGEERVLAYDMPGTTRDTIHVPFERDGHRYTLIDTAGVRRRARIREALEKFSVIKALQAMEEAHVVIMVLDAHEGISEQDASLLGLAVESGRALVVAVNKWDGLTPGERERVREALQIRLPFIDFAEIHFISALHGTGIGHLLEAVERAYRAATRDLPTPLLNRILEEAVAAHAPPLVRGRRIKLRYAHQGGRNPPVIVIHGNQTESVPDAYRRYLVNTFRRALDLKGTPMRVEFKGGANPYAGRRNKLTPRQQKRRKRLMKHVKKRR
ncbi:MAG TPA: ribosome biogenesis GTPase Der [Thiotrichales bacterium]|nr:ribosome biogenesis GTPase Der [Thiotrichales bacterium]